MSEWIISDEDLGCDGAYLSYQQIVRCKDCRWFDGEELCEKHGIFVALDLTFFCKNGEKRMDGETRGATE